LVTYVVVYRSKAENGLRASILAFNVGVKNLEEIVIGGIKYRVECLEDEIILKRFNEKHEIWVSLSFPKSRQIEGKKIEESLIETLANLYVQRSLNNFKINSD